jgi:hypothetical protein
MAMALRLPGTLRDRLTFAHDEGEKRAQDVRDACSGRARDDKRVLSPPA